ncbi:hypothetical protein IWW50_001412 [Coemansia erecta]|nr:hypothetical protein GGF43_001144 [Coemansia sp. RSA 2618]KAJ2828388.1 hypothetical protein IWW50_001412 [Coemansia erecta]
MLRPFRIPETRLLAINELVAQVTLTFRTDEDEEVRYRYEQDADLQSLVQTAVVSLVNCGYTNGVARGPGFILHQMRKKWPIGRRYIFTRHGEPMQSSLHKYFLQLELVDDIDERGHEAPTLEIAELRGVAMSPSASSIAGSTIEGLDAVTLPPMAAIFGQGHPQMGDVMGHRRSGSGYSVNSGYSGRSGYSGHQRPHSPFYYEANRQRPESPSLQRSAAPRVEELESEYRNARESAYPELQPAHADVSLRGTSGIDNFGSPAQSTVRTRSISRSSVGSVRTMQSVEMRGRSSQTVSPQVRPSVVAAAAAASGPASRAGDSLTPREPPSAPVAVSPVEQQRLGRTSWYRSLHGISPLSRQAKSLSSSDNEIHLGAIAESAEMATQIPRVAGNAQQKPTTGLRPPRAPTAKDSGLNGLAHRLTRKILSPINIHKAKHSQQRRKSKLAREFGTSDTGSDDVDTSDFTGPKSDGVSDSEARASVGVSRVLESAIPIPAAAAKRPASVEGDFNSSGRAESIGKTGATGISRPDMPPPKKRPARQPQPVESVSEPVSIPTSVKNALLRRLKSPLGHRPDRSSSRLSVRDRISAFNGLSVKNSAASAPKQSRIPSPAGILTPVTQESADDGGGFDGHSKLGAAPVSAVSADAMRQRSAIPTPGTPPVSAHPGRTRIGTATGFISMASPGNPASLLERPQSRASSITNGRAASPALSHMSNVSTRVQDAINALERASSGANKAATPRNGDARPLGGSNLSGTKRGATVDQLDYMASPTKRPRAPSAAAHDGPRPGSRLNPLNMVQRMVRRHTGR